jgi:diguanylate cyclase (GGDEF)-like protein
VPAFHIHPPGPYLCLPLAVHGEMLGLLHLNLTAGDHADEDQRGLAVTFGEIVKLSPANLKLREVLGAQAIHDSLTGLFNRQYLDETLAREVHRAQRQKASLCVAMLDIDHFKKFNDTYGHEAGDEVLRELGKFLRQSVRVSDIACRYGGEEFILILLDTDVTTAVVRLQGVCRDIKGKRFELRGMSLPAVTVSVGLAQLPVHGTTPEELIRASDDALYVSKNTGRDRIEIFSGLRQESPTVASPS